MKTYKPFIHLVTDEQQLKLQYERMNTDALYIEHYFDRRSVLNFEVMPMPAVCRSKRRETRETKETMFVTEDPPPIRL